MSLTPKNTKIITIPLLNVSATVPPHAPTTTAVVARFTMQKAGVIKRAAAIVAVAGTAGNSADLKDTLKINKRGVTGAVAAVAVTSEVSLIDVTQTPDLILAAGARVNMEGLPGNHCVEGEICDVQWTETGTINTGTRPTFNILAIEVEFDTNSSVVQP